MIRLVRVTFVSVEIDSFINFTLLASVSIAPSSTAVSAYTCVYVRVYMYVCVGLVAIVKFYSLKIYKQKEGGKKER